MEPAENTRFTEDEYLALERASTTKHEFVDGRIVAMAGGSVRHNLIATNIAGALRTALRDRPCVVLNSDQRVHIAATGRYTYPDVTVLCGKAKTSPADPLAIQNPVLLFEVLSRSTAHYDTGEKFDDFRKIETLVEFVAVRADVRRVEHWRRTEIGRWLLTESEAAGSLVLDGQGVTIPLDEIYAKLELAAD